MEKAQPWKNHKHDKHQYESYRNILGEDYLPGYLITPEINQLW